jgi:predicted nucleic acid-binding protein
MPFVVDASVAAGWLLPDENASLARLALHRIKEDAAVAPGQFWYEVRNILIVNERRGRIDSDRTGEALAMLNELPIRLDHLAEEATLLALARRYGLTVYDASYLELAARLDAPLATVDPALIRAAAPASVTILGAV